MPTPTEEAQRLIATLDLNQTEVAARLTTLLKRPVKSYTVSRILSGDRQVKADELDALRSLARQPDGGADEAPATAPRAIRLTDSPELTPLYAAVGPSEPLRLGEGNMVGTAPIHPAQKGAPNAFAFVVPNDQVGDALQRGWIGYALRGRQPLKGQMCLVETKDGASCYIYEDQDDRTLFLRVKKPKDEAKTVALRDVQGLHVIVGATFGIV